MMNKRIIDPTKIIYKLHFLEKIKTWRKQNVQNNKKKYHLGYLFIEMYTVQSEQIIAALRIIQAKTR